MMQGRLDHYAGALLGAIGLCVAYVGSTYEIGRLNAPGPGFFPLILGVLLSIIGLFVALLPSPAAEADAIGKIDLDPVPPRLLEIRGWGCIIASVIVFIAFAKYFGLLPAIFACAFVAAIGDKNSTVKSSVALAAGLTAFGVVLFSYVLHIQIPIVRGF